MEGTWIGTKDEVETNIGACTMGIQKAGTIGIEIRTQINHLGRKGLIAPAS